MKPSQSSFGSRVDRAKKVLVHAQTFTDFNPPVEQSVKVFGMFLDTVERNNTDAAAKTAAYSNAVDKRRKTFKDDTSSLYNTANQVLAAVRAQYGVKSKQASDIRTIVNKLSPTSKKAPKLPDTVAGQGPTDSLPKSISKRETGFGNMLKTFADLAATVKNYGATYKPGNLSLTIEALEKRVIELSEINKSVTANYSALQQVRFDRIALYDQLTDNVQRIKNAVKSQYGNKSLEYSLMKAIKG